MIQKLETLTNCGNFRSSSGPTSVNSHILLQNARVDIEEQRVLSGLSLDIDVARLGVVGRNGSGKSTFARLVAGLIEPTAGTIEVNGYDLAKSRKAALAEVGIIFQNPDHQIIFPTVEEEISFGLRQLGRSKDLAKITTQRTPRGSPYRPAALVRPHEKA